MDISVCTKVSMGNKRYAMKPTTLFLYIYLSFCAVAVVMAWSATVVSESRGLAKLDTISIQKEQIQSLTLRNDYLVKSVREMKGE